jgi:hypothetical protein
MKLDFRILLPAALVAGALAIPAGTGVADPPATGACPDHYLGPFPIGGLTNHDNNNNGYVCVKDENMNLIFKDDNCNPNCDADDIIVPTGVFIPEDTIVDDIL